MLPNREDLTRPRALGEADAVNVLELVNEIKHANLSIVSLLETFSNDPILLSTFR